MTDDLELTEDDVPPVESPKWTIEHLVGTTVGRGGGRVKSGTGIDRIRYHNKTVGNCGRKPGSILHITHPSPETSEADYAELMQLLAERDADRYNRLYAKEGEELKVAANFMDREVDKVPDDFNPDMLD